MPLKQKKQPKNDAVQPLLPPIHQVTRRGTTSFYYRGVRVQRKNPRKRKNDKDEPPPSHWTVRVGDVLAVACGDSIVPKKNGQNPFRRKWSPAQVLALFRTGETWEMRIRWFWRRAELPEDTQQALLDDETVPNEVFESNDMDTFDILPSSLLGRVRLVSSQRALPENSVGVAADGMAQVTLLCRTYLLDDDDENSMVEVDDWNGHELLPTSEPLLRGLRQLEDERLSVATRRALDEEYKDERQEFENDESASRDVSMESVHAITFDEDTLREESTEDEADQDSNAEDYTLDSQILQCSSQAQRTYYDSITVPVRSEMCAPRVVRKATNESWKVQIGDIVCLRSKEATPQADILLKEYKKKSTVEARMWYPFVVPWAVCQILSIYKENKPREKVKLEVRWFYRTSALSNCVRERMPAPTNERIEEVFETDRVQHDVLATGVIGRVDLLFANQNKTTSRAVSGIAPVPIVSCRCRYFFVTQENINHFQPIYTAALSLDAWSFHCVRRGIEHSDLLLDDDKLKRQVETLIGSEADSCFMDDQDEVNEPFFDVDPDHPHVVARLRLEPWWDYFYLSKVLCGPVNSRNNFKWTVSVGDVVAIHDADAKTPSFPKMSRKMDKWYPYTDKWSAGQVLAFLDVETENPQVEIRWFYRPSDFSHKKFLPNKIEKEVERLGVDPIFETTEKGVYSIKVLLGPLTVLTHERQLQEQPPFMPQAVVFYAGQYDAKRKKVKQFPWSRPEVVRRGIACSDEYASRSQRESMTKRILGSNLARQQNISSPGSNSSNTTDSERLIDSEKSGKPVKRRKTMVDEQQHISGSRRSCVKKAGTVKRVKHADEFRVWTSVPPYHLDISRRRTYYMEVNVAPPYKNYSFGRSKLAVDQPDSCSWTVKMGDVVVVHWEVGAGRSYFDGSHPATSRHHPFTVPWAIGEVITLWKEHDTVDEVNGSISLLASGIGNEDNIMAEIRWLYRKDEIPGSSNNVSSAMDAFMYEEVFETDHLDECNATSFLAPVILHTAPARSEASRTQLGMPVMEFYCRLFWSIHRRCRVPCGDASGRSDRGRMYSNHFGVDEGLKTAFQRSSQAEGSAVPLNGSDTYGKELATSWKQSFQNVVKKLSLVDASNDTSVVGMTLTCRDKEQDQIKSFLRLAISRRSLQEDDEESSKPSILIAGPPGTGKTASVRSIVAQMRREQARGEIPAFDFVALNGMELRHPLEAYVKLWEILSGPRKEKRPPEIAAAQLERYFSGANTEDSGTGKNRTIVLLLDEIDYLVTKKQTVLYNFFNWPVRALHSPGAPRLIVIGISNTLNLPSRLKPSVHSRLGKARCDFKAYNVQDLVKILKNKIETTSHRVFEDDAILFAAKKTASLSGDLRKGMLLCRLAAENVLRTAESGTWVDPLGKAELPIVRIRDVQKTSRVAFGSVMVTAVSHATSFEVLLLVSLASLERTTGRQRGCFNIQELLSKMSAVADSMGKPLYLPPPTFGETLEMLTRLGEARLVSLSTPRSSNKTFRAAQGGSGGAWPQISLPLDASDILSALRGTSHQDLAEKYLGGLNLF